MSHERIPGGSAPGVTGDMTAVSLLVLAHSGMGAFAFRVPSLTCVVAACSPSRWLGGPFAARKTTVMYDCSVSVPFGHPPSWRGTPGEFVTQL